jgi:hypothetical protein
MKVHGYATKLSALKFSSTDYHTNKGSRNATTFGCTASKTFNLKAFLQNPSLT